MLTLENSQDLARFLLKRYEAIRFLACARERFLHHHCPASIMSIRSTPFVKRYLRTAATPRRVGTLALALVLTVLPCSERLLRKLSMTPHARRDHHQLRLHVPEETLGIVVPLRRRVVVRA
jgi:hypothetical protein